MRGLLARLTVIAALGGSWAAVAVPVAHADPQLDAEVQVALGYWAKRGVTTCPAVSATVALHPQGVPSWGWAYAGSCAVALDPEFHAMMRAGTKARSTRRGSRALECSVVVHEVGHALGLQHTDGARFRIMGEYGHASIPRACDWFGRARSSLVAVDPGSHRSRSPSVAVREGRLRSW